jgi:flagellar FliL protein
MTMAKAAPSGDDAAPAKKKKGGMVKILLFVVIGLVLVGGGVGGTLYAVNAGLLGGGKKAEPEVALPRLVPKAEEKRASASGEGESGGGHAEPLGTGGDKYASTYYPMEKEFTANVKDSSHYVQVGIAVSTPYDERVIANLRTHEIAVRSAILMALGDANEDQVFSAQGKRDLQIHIAHAINDVLKQKEGFGGISNVYFTNFVVQ